MSLHSSFYVRLLARRGGNAACGQYPASGRARDGRRFRSWRALSLLCTRHSPSDERPSSRFRGIASPPKSLAAAVFHGRPDPLPDAGNSPQAAGNGIAVMPPAPSDYRSCYVEIHSWGLY
ncbi:hypothetical protein M9289_004642 [Salmonella enterica]|nr:hypothetical protein [Salmonella enterica]